MLQGAASHNVKSPGTPTSAPGNKCSIEWFAVALLFIGALALRVLAAWLEPTLSRDSILYISYAEEWSGSWRTHQFRLVLPLWPGFLAICHELGMSTVWAGRIANLLMGAAIPLLFLKSGTQLFRNRMLAWFAAILAATHPMLVKHSISIQRETMYLFFLMLCFIAVVAGDGSRKFRHFAVGGAMAALTVLTRAEGVEILLIVAGYLAYSGICGRFSWGAVGKMAAAFFGTALVVFILISWIAGFNVIDYVDLIGRYWITAGGTR